MAWRTHPQWHRGYLYLRRPKVVFQAKIDSGNTVTYGKYLSTEIWYLLYFDDIYVGDTNASAVKEGMTLLLGSTPGDDNYGRARVKGVVTEGYTGGSEKVIKVFASDNIHDGELRVSTTSYITVLDDYRIWFKQPYYGAYNQYYYDGDTGHGGTTDHQFPIANTGAPYIGFADGSNEIAVTLDGSESHVVAHQQALGGWESVSLLGIIASSEDGTNVVGNAVDGDGGTHWRSTATGTQWIQVNISGGPPDRSVLRFSITADTTLSAPQDFTLYSLDPTYVLAEVTGETGWSDGEKRTYYIDRNHNLRLYRFRLSITAGNGAAKYRIREFEIDIEDRDSSSPYTWDVDDGSYDTGSSTSEAPTCTFPLGDRNVELTVTDTDSYEGVAHTPVVAVPRTDTALTMDYTGATYAASSEDGTDVADNAFDSDDSTHWATTSGNTTGNVSVVLASAQRVTRYGLTPGPRGLTPRDFNFGYYNASEADWIDLDVQTDQQWNIEAEHPDTEADDTEVMGQLTYAAPFSELDYSGATISASNEDGAQVASKAFDGSSSTYWGTQAGITTATLECNFGTPTRVDQYRLQRYILSIRNPTAWTLQYYDGSWQTADTQSGITWSEINELKTYTLAESFTAERWRLSVSASQSTYIELAELDLLQGTATESHQKLMQTFTVDSDTSIVVFEADLKKTESPTDNLTIKLYSLDSSGDPDALQGTSDTVAASGLGGVVAETVFSFSTPVSLTAGAYGAVLERSGGSDQTDYVEWSTDSTEGYLDGTLRAYDGSAWSTVAADGIFTLLSNDEETYDLDQPITTTWYRLEITDNNDTDHIELAELTLYDVHNAPIENFEILSHRQTREGQEMVFRVYEDIDLDDYPDGTLVMYFEEEFYADTQESISDAGPTGREHIKFWGWIDTEPTEIEATETDTRKYVELRCIDVGMRLQQLPMFPLMVERESSSTPSNVFQMDQANIDRIMYLMARWFTTIAEVTDFIWSGGVDYWACSVLSVDGGTMWHALDDRAQAMGYFLTCNKHGKLQVIPDALLLDWSPDPNFLTLDGDDIVRLSYTSQRPPRYHWNWESAIGVNRTDADAGPTIVTYFCVAPGETPGQGGQSAEHGEQIVGSWWGANPQGELNERAGQRYAIRLNAPYGYFRVDLAHGNDTGIDPAAQHVIRVTLSADEAAQRGLTFTTEPMVPVEVITTYDPETMTKSRSVVLERYIDGVPAETYEP